MSDSDADSSSLPPPPPPLPHPSSSKVKGSPLEGKISLPIRRPSTNSDRSQAPLNQPSNNSSPVHRARTNQWGQSSSEPSTPPITDSFDPIYGRRRKWRPWLVVSLTVVALIIAAVFGLYLARQRQVFIKHIQDHHHQHNETTSLTNESLSNNLDSGGTEDTQKTNTSQMTESSNQGEIPGNILDTNSPASTRNEPLGTETNLPIGNASTSGNTESGPDLETKNAPLLKETISNQEELPEKTLKASVFVNGPSSTEPVQKAAKLPSTNLKEDLMEALMEGNHQTINQLKRASPNHVLTQEEIDELVKMGESVPDVSAHSSEEGEESSEEEERTIPNTVSIAPQPFEEQNSQSPPEHLGLQNEVLQEPADVSVNSPNEVFPGPGHTIEEEIISGDLESPTGEIEQGITQLQEQPIEVSPSESPVNLKEETPEVSAFNEIDSSLHEVSEAVQGRPMQEDVPTTVKPVEVPIFEFPASEEGDEFPPQPDVKAPGDISEYPTEQPPTQEQPFGEIPEPSIDVPLEPEPHEPEEDPLSEQPFRGIPEPSIDVPLEPEPREPEKDPLSEQLFGGILEPSIDVPLEPREPEKDLLSELSPGKNAVGLAQQPHVISSEEFLEYSTDDQDFLRNPREDISGLSAEDIQEIPLAGTNGSPGKSEEYSVGEIVQPNEEIQGQPMVFQDPSFPAFSDQEIQQQEYLTGSFPQEPLEHENPFRDVPDQSNGAPEYPDEYIPQEQVEQKSFENFPEQPIAMPEFSDTGIIMEQPSEVEDAPPRILPEEAFRMEENHSGNIAEQPIERYEYPTENAQRQPEEENVEEAPENVEPVLWYDSDVPIPLESPEGNPESVSAFNDVTAGEETPSSLSNFALSPFSGQFYDPVFTPEEDAIPIHTASEIVPFSPVGNDVFYQTDVLGGDQLKEPLEGHLPEYGNIDLSENVPEDLVPANPNEIDLSQNDVFKSSFGESFDEINPAEPTDSFYSSAQGLEISPSLELPDEKSVQYPDEFVAPVVNESYLPPEFVPEIDAASFPEGPLPVDDSQELVENSSTLGKTSLEEQENEGAVQNEEVIPEAPDAGVGILAFTEGPSVFNEGTQVNKNEAAEAVGGSLNGQFIRSLYEDDEPRTTGQRRSVDYRPLLPVDSFAMSGTEGPSSPSSPRLVSKFTVREGPPILLPHGSLPYQIPTTKRSSLVIPEGTIATPAVILENLPEALKQPGNPLSASSFPLQISPGASQNRVFENLPIPFASPLSQLSPDQLKDLLIQLSYPRTEAPPVNLNNFPQTSPNVAVEPPAYSPPNPIQHHNLSPLNTPHQLPVNPSHQFLHPVYSQKHPQPVSSPNQDIYTSNSPHKLPSLVNPPHHLPYPVNSYQNVPQPVNSPHQLLNAVHSPLQRQNPASSPDHHPNPVRTPNQPPNSPSSPQHSRDSVNTSTQHPRPVNIHPHVMHSVKPSHQSLNPVNPPTQQPVRPPNQHFVNPPNQHPVNPHNQLSVNPSNKYSVNPPSQHSVNPPNQHSVNSPKQHPLNPSQKLPESEDSSQQLSRLVNPPHQLSYRTNPSHQLPHFRNFRHQTPNPVKFPRQFPNREGYPHQLLHPINPPQGHSDSVISPDNQVTPQQAQIPISAHRLAENVGNNVPRPIAPPKYSALQAIRPYNLVKSPQHNSPVQNQPHASIPNNNPYGLASQYTHGYIPQLHQLPTPINPSQNISFLNNLKRQNYPVHLRRPPVRYIPENVLRSSRPNNININQIPDEKKPLLEVYKAEPLDSKRISGPTPVSAPKSISQPNKPLAQSRRNPPWLEHLTTPLPANILQEKLPLSLDNLKALAPTPTATDSGTSYPTKRVTTGPVSYVPTVPQQKFVPNLAPLERKTDIPSPYVSERPLNRIQSTPSFQYLPLNSFVHAEKQAPTLAPQATQILFEPVPPNSVLSKPVTVQNLAPTETLNRIFPVNHYSQYLPSNVEMKPMTFQETYQPSPSSAPSQFIPLFLPYHENPSLPDDNVPRPDVAALSKPISDPIRNEHEDLESEFEPVTYVFDPLSLGNYLLRQDSPDAPVFPGEECTNDLPVKVPLDLISRAQVPALAAQPNHPRTYPLQQIRQTAPLVEYLTTPYVWNEDPSLFFARNLPSPPIPQSFLNMQANSRGGSPYYASPFSPPSAFSIFLQNIPNSWVQPTLSIFNKIEWPQPFMFYNM